MSKRLWTILSVVCKRRTRRAWRAVLAAALLSTATPTFASTEVSGTIGTNTRWDIDGSPYIVKGIIFVTATLTVDPGVQVLFDDYHGFYITSGALNAVGKADSLIVFASAKPSPGLLDWPGITFGASSNDALCVIEHAVIAFAGGGIQITDASPHIENVRIAHGWDAGIQVSGGSPEIINSVIHGIVGSASIAAGIYCVGAGTPVITGNAIFANSKGIFLTNQSSNYPNPTIADNGMFINTINLRAASATNHGSTTITAEDNWWGVTGSSPIAATIVDHTDDSNFPIVDFDPFLASSPFSPDNTAPAVSISLPAASSTVSGKVSITGTASDANLETGLRVKAL